MPIVRRLLKGIESIVRPLIGKWMKWNHTIIDISPTALVSQDAQSQDHSPQEAPAPFSDPRPIFAMVIGIDKYLDGGPSPLKGCINDSNSMYTYLKDKLHVPEANIVLLQDDLATRDTILATFQNHFINNPDINIDDAIIFYFAGHGSRQKAPPDWHAEDDRVETICPYDVAKVCGIPDYTLANLVRKLAFKKGNNITLIFDSCHSGGMGRADEETEKDAPLTRFYDPFNDLPIPADLDCEIWAWTPDGTRSQVSQPDMPSSLPKAMEGHVLLAACQPRQRAKEACISGLWCGAFTNALLISLKVWDPRTSALTYSRLMENLSPLEDQNPHCEGKNKIKRLFSPSEEGQDDPTAFVVTAVDSATNDEYYVAVGHLLGIVKGTEFITHPPSGITPITLVAKIVEEFRCRVVPCRKQTSPAGHEANLKLTPIASILPGHSRATVSKRATKWLRVELIPRDAFPQIIEGTDSLFSIVESGGELIASLVEGAPEVVQLIRNDPLIGSQPECRCISIDFKSFTMEYLNKAAHFHFFLYRHRLLHLIQPHPTQDSANMSVTLSFQRLNKSSPVSAIQNQKVSIPDGHNLFHAQTNANNLDQGLAGIALLEGTVATTNHYGFTLHNKTLTDFFPYVFYFNPLKYKIESLYLPHESSVSPPLTRYGTDGSSLGIGYGSHGTETITFKLPDGINHDSGFIKVFVSTVYINMELTNSERLDLVKNKRSILECSDSWVYLVTVRR